MSGTTGLNPAISLQAGAQLQQQQQQQNPLQTFGQVLQTKNALNQLQLFPGQMQQQQLAIQGQDLANQMAQLQQHQQRLTYFAGLMLPELVDANGQPTTGVAGKDIAKSLATAVSDGYLQPSEAVQLQTSLPGGAQDDPVANRRWVLQHFAANQVAGGHINEILGALGRSPSTVATGGGTIAGSTAGPLAQGAGSFQPQSYVPNTVGPGQAAAPETRIGPDGKPIIAPAGAYMPPNLVSPQGVQQLTPQSQGLGGAQAPGAAPPGTQLPLPSPAAPPRLPGAGGAPMAGMPVGTPEYMAATAGDARSANQRAATFASDMFPLTQAQQALANAPTGKGSQAAHDVSSYLNTFAPEWLNKALSFVSPVMTKDEVAAYDEAKKYLTQGQLGVSGATRSNEGLSTAGAASPSTQISKEAAQLVLKGMIGLRRMEQEGTLEFNNSGLPPADYGKFSANFATKADPRVYTFDQYTPQQRSDVLASIKDPQKRTQFMAQVERAEQNGILSPPNGP